MRFACLILFLFGLLTLQAQTLTEFPAVPDDFVKEMDKFLKSTKRADCQMAADEFTELYKAGSLSPTHLEEIITTSNIMLARKMRAYPYFEIYIRTVNGFVKNNKPVDLFIKWSDILNKITEAQRRGDNKDFSAYVEFSDALFTNSSIYLSRSKSWFVKTDNYQLDYTNEQPKAIFPSLDLIATNFSDSIIISNTAGSYNPLENIWTGKKGLVDWTRAGFASSQVYAEVDNYKIDVTKTEFQIDSVKFYHKEYFNFPLEGNYIDKLTAQQNEISYPRFESFRKDIPIDDLTPNVKYIGGFALHGDKVIGTGDAYSRATLEFYNDQGTRIIRAKSKEMLLRKTESLSARKAEVSLYMDKDSIYHPGLNLIYKIDLREVALYRGDNGIAATPFFDSYHEHEIRTDAIVWKLDEPYIDVKMMSGAGQAPATFTSSNFFRKGELEKFQGVMDFNPISDIYVYAKRNDTREIYAPDLAKKMNPNYTESTIKGLLYKMVEEGFIYYDEDISTITVNDKVFNYIAANAELIDFDVIQVRSFSPKLNGKIYFENQDIDLVGVNRVLLSDSQNVFIYPQQEQLKLQKNKDMAFSGTVFAGRLDFKGEGFHFTYDSFMIDLTDLAAAIIYVPSQETDQSGTQILVPLQSKIEGLTGFLEIDKPDNKSGKENYPQYPIFTNMDKSYVYYDDSTIHSGAYIKDAFYFELIPFVFDSLDTFDPYLSDFEGTLVSAGIFPDFDYNLEIQRDLSLGFKRITPENGYKIYDGKGEYNDSIFLSNAGLRGSGKWKYLFNEIESNDIIFFPDSMNAFAQSFAMDQTTYEGVTFPIVKGADNQIHWRPYEDSMRIDMTDSPFYMYEDSATLAGNLIFTKKGLKGDGEFEFKEASLSSDLFNFQSESLDSDTLSLRIKSIDEDRVTFNTPNVQGRVDFAEREGEFKSNEAGIETEFSNNLYKTSINEFFWDMDGNYLDFKAPPGEPVYFTSTRPDQDSLKFLGQRAFFDMSTSIIHVDSVPEVLVADARIFPDSQRVTILPGGLLDSLDRAVIVFDTAKQNYKVYDARVKINSKKDFTGDGIFDYTPQGMPPYPIILHEIGVMEEKERRNTYYRTYANGMLEPEEAFSLHKKIEFNGLVNLDFKNDYLIFDGFARLNLNNKSIPTAWFTMRDEINPDSVVIRYDVPAGQEGDSLFTGIYFDLYDSVSSVYTRLMSPLNANNDFKIFDAKGIITYDDDQKLFVMGEPEKIFGESLTGNVLTYDESANKIFAEGNFDFGLELDPVKIKTSGSIENDLDSASYAFNTFLALDIPVEKDIMEFFATDLTNFVYANQDVNYVSQTFEKSLSELLDEKKAKRAIDDLRKTGQFVQQKDLGHNLVISNVRLLFEPEYQLYRSVGPISVSFVGEKGIHKEVKGYVELGYQKNNDFFNIYLESGTEHWYFLSYNNQKLQILASNKDFNKLLAAVAPDNRKDHLAQEEFYFYTVNTYTKMQEFLQRMRMIEQGIKVDIQDVISEDDIFLRELEEIKQELMQAEELRKEDSLADDGVIIVGDDEEKAVPKAVQEYEENQKKSKKDRKKAAEEETDELEDIDKVEDVDELKERKKQEREEEAEKLRELQRLPPQEKEQQEEPEEKVIPKAVQEYEENQKKDKKDKKKDEPKEDEPVERDLKLIPQETEEGVSDFEMMMGDDKKKKKKKKKSKDEEDQ